MIISASYRSDIPAYHGDWFLARFRAGRALVVNPYGGGVAAVPLRAGVDGYVFWSRDPARFEPGFEAVRAAGLPFVLQHTLTDYPAPLERSGDPARRIAAFRALAARHGPEALVWRYDPVLIGPRTPPAWHLERFAALAAALEGACDEVVVSFATFYRKVERRLAQLGEGWSDPPPAAKQALLLELAGLAAARGIRLALCCQPALVAATGLPAAACIDPRRLERVAAAWGQPRSVVARPRPNRPGCGCADSRDIGAYDTCPRGCAFCYAVNRSGALYRPGPESECLGPLPVAEGEGPRLLL